ncbi:TonB-dependent receptor plug domain-containing protein [Chitinivibrio alkaliphilus]|uniref:TonB-dependent receptor n=1 Tax=Chitinivibrio alkaliphilus ACht1 TaxID=1313304 RepID=U7DEN3_9BACT|nr:TonB-dependent receptor [Chitinivibrio alkaliphilus]ERP39401.1 TonB-dependent receptor [Chitinivibrio alkaliphilus ACht1]
MKRPLLLTVLCMLCFAGEDPLLTMTFEELMQVQVTVSSRMDETVSRAPGFVSVHTADDIRSYGHFSLGDLANSTPGYSTNIRFGERGLETRGQGFDGWNNNKHLLLVDGIPVRHVRANKVFIEENMPVLGASQVEFLRGPASALYGVGAFYGVLNVVYDDPPPGSTRGFARIFAGNERSTRGNFAALSHHGSAGVSHVEAARYTREASRTPVMGDSRRLYRDHTYASYARFSHAFSTGRAHGLGIGVLYSEKEGGIGEFWGSSTHKGNRVVWTTLMPYVRYETDISERLSLESYLTVTESAERGLRVNNQYNTAIPQDIIGEYDERLRSLDYVTEFQYEIDSFHTVKTGLNLYSHSGLGRNGGTRHWFVSASDTGIVWDADTAFEAETEPTYTLSGYAQYQGRFPVLSGLHVTAGFREDFGTYRDHSFRRISPRLALVQGFSPRFSGRLLFGTALRAPGQKELSLNDEAQRRFDAEEVPIRIADLEEEYLYSLETGVSYAGDVVYISGALFYNSTDNTIENYTPDTTEGGMNLNAFRNARGSIDAYGGEVETIISPGTESRLFANYAWARSEDAAGKRIVGMPTHKFSLGGRHRFLLPVPLTVSVLNSYTAGYVMGDRSTGLGRGETSFFLSGAVSRHLSVELQGKNIFDDTTPLISGSQGVQEYTVPVQGRRWYAGMSLTL